MHRLHANDQILSPESLKNTNSEMHASQGKNNWNSSDYASLEHYRDQMKQARKDTEPGHVYFDSSPVGSGKSFLNALHVQKFESSRTLVKTHRSAAETLAAYEKAGVKNVAAYPKLTEDNCRLFTHALRAQMLGLNVGTSLCEVCHLTDSCEYRRNIRKAQDAPHQILSHDRGRVRPATLGKADLIIIEEDCIGLMRPVIDASCGFMEVVALAAQAADSISGNATDEKNKQLRSAVQRLQEVATEYERLLSGGTAPTEIELPIPLSKPHNLEKLLAQNLRHVRTLGGMALKICLGAVFGEWKRIVFSVDRLWNAETNSHFTQPRIIAVGETKMPEDAEIWVTDATARYSQICSIFPRAENRTPQTKIQLQHPIQQVPIDVCKSSDVEDVSKLLKRLLAQYCRGDRVGLITHQEFLPDMLHLTSDERNHIAMSSYFGAGDDVGSNYWYKECDKLLILGTPRTALCDVKSRGIQGGHADFDHRHKHGNFGSYKWKGEMSDGRKANVPALRYKRKGWTTIGEELVQDKLNQAAGRGRGFLKDGIPVIIVTTEPMGHPLLELPQRPKKLQPVFEAIRDGLDNVNAICQRTGKSESTVKRHVVELSERGEIFRESKRRRILISPPAPPT